MNHGFTMIELIIVIVILGILSVGSVRFISQTTQGVIDSAERQRIASIGIIAMEKMSRELREALPNSIRVDGSGECIEFVPIAGGSQYTDIPILTASTTITAVKTNYAASLNTTYDRIAVFPASLSQVYGGADPGPISSLISTIAVIAGDEEGVTLSSNHQFLADSPQRRFFIVKDPVTYCYSGGILFRYKNYGFQSAMGTSRPTTFAGGREVLANSLTSATFSYVSATLSRNGVVSIDMTLSEGGETQMLDYEVIIRNVP
ncbi:hypothetical protein A9Q81_02365 [Gammaproteobacteria bacterium 42_54_T18]|nr:hypothetical protein A9Q81_02365 [Gammaproteobacteria bacterium 42_54_T18]